MTNPTSNHIFLELHVPDFIVVKNFYQKLNFNVVWETPGEYLVMRLNDNILGFYGGNSSVFEHPFFKQFPSSTPRGYGVEITIQITQDIEKFYKQVSTNLPDKSILNPLTQVDYTTSKKWEFRLVDPFGYYLHFTEPVNYLYR